MPIENLNRMKNGQNPFVTLLNLLKVKHTQDFSNQYFNEHPHKNNLFGLSKMLSDYGVENAGTRIADKENDLPQIECPFIAHAGADFVVVYKVESTSKSPKGDFTSDQPEKSNLPLQGAGGKVHYFWNGKKIAVTVQQFIQSWTGFILLAETTPHSGEPDYQEHRKRELFAIAQKSLLFLTGVLLLGIAYFKNSLYKNLGISLLLLINLIGSYISYLLVLKQMHIHSRYADKICSLFSKSDCNNVLEMDAAKLWGIFGWSEIGLGYFVANVLLLLFLPQTVFLLAILNLFTLPYSLWSVWYQKVIARQWCALCLVVQVLLWSIFIINLVFGYIQITALSYSIIPLFIFIVCTYAISVFSLNLLIPNLSRGGEVEQITQEINAIKANEELFKTLLMQQPQYEVSRADSQILFGNPEARLQIIILTNPFCNPCAKMHKRVEKILKDTKREISIQYILSSFNADLEFANKYLIAAYFKNSHCVLNSILDHPQSPEQIFTDWFEKGKPLKEAFFREMQLDMTNPEIEAEFQKHEAWKAKTRLHATPTILVNGYKLPDNYKIEDLRYFTNFVIGRSEARGNPPPTP